MRATPIPGREQLLSERRRLRRKHKALYDQLARILFEHDPIGIASAADEYEPEVGRILIRAAAARSVDELTDAIHSVFVEMFDLSTAGSRAKYEAVARDLWKALRRRESVSEPRGTRQASGPAHRPGRGDPGRP